MMPYGSPISSGIDANREYEIKRIMAEDAIARQRAEIEQKTLDRMTKIGDRLKDSFIEFQKDPEYADQHGLVVDAAMNEIKALRGGRPVSPQFTAFLKKNPDQALQMMMEAGKSGMSAAQFFEMAHDPLTVMTGITAMQGAKRELRKRAAGTEGDGGGSSAPATTPATSGQPLGGGLSAPGLARSPQPFGPSPALVDEGGAGVQPGRFPGQPVIDSEVDRLKRFIIHKERQINALRQEGVDEKTLGEHTKELATARQDLRNLVTKGPLEEQTKSIEVVPDDELSKGTESLQRSGRPDLARRIITGMRRGAFDRVMSQVGTTQSSAPNAEVPTTPTRSPNTQIPSTLTGPINPVQTPQERLKEKGDEEVRVQSEKELLQQSAKDLKTITDKGMADREKLKLFSVMTEAAKNVGPTGEYLTPMRTHLNNLANLVGVDNPQFLSQANLITKLQNQLSFEMVHQLGNRVTNNELQTALRSLPGLFTTNEGMAILLKVGEILSKEGVWADQQARKWVSDPTHGRSLYGTDRDGKTFQQALDDALDEHYKKNGNVGEQVARFFGSDPKDILKGKITPLANRGGRSLR